MDNVVVLKIYNSFTQPRVIDEETDQSVLCGSISFLGHFCHHPSAELMSPPWAGSVSTALLIHCCGMESLGL